MFENMKTTVSEAEWFGEILSRAHVKKVQTLQMDQRDLKRNFFSLTQLLHSRTLCFVCRRQTEEAATKKSGEATGYFLHQQAHL